MVTPPLCGQINCERTAAAMMLWPLAIAEIGLCDVHLLKAQEVAAAMEFRLDWTPLHYEGDEDESKHYRCRECSWGWWAPADADGIVCPKCRCPVDDSQ